MVEAWSMSSELINMLDELTEVPFEVFWDKWQELKPGIYNMLLAEQEWFYMREQDRITAFTALCNNHPAVYSIKEPFMFLAYFELPF
jgi:hypothetical protein